MENDIKKDLKYARDMLIDIKKICYKTIENKQNILNELSNNIENLIDVSNKMKKSDVIKNAINKKNNIDKKAEEDIIKIKKVYY